MGLWSSSVLPGCDRAPEQPHMTKPIENTLAYGQGQFISSGFPASSSQVCPLQPYSPEPGTLGCWGPQVSVDLTTRCCRSWDHCQGSGPHSMLLGPKVPILPWPKTRSLIQHREERPIASIGYVALFTDSALAEDGRKEYLGPGRAWR